MSAPHPLVIVAERDTPRLRYALDTCWRDTLGFEYQLVLPSEPRPQSPVPALNYTRLAISGTIPLACNGLLYEDHIREDVVEFAVSVPPSDREPLWPADHLAYAFYRLTEYGHYAHPQRDGHGRYRDALAEPSVEQGLAAMETLLAPLYDPHNPPRPARRFDYEITIDVDHPWKFRYKGGLVMAGGLLKDLLRLRGGLLRERLRFLGGGADPYEGAEAKIRRLCPPDKTSIFFLVDGEHVNDSRFSLRMAPYRAMVERFREAGYGIGLHPSYLSMGERDRMAAEKALLEEVAGPVERSRQHYLRYQLPDTFRYLCELGIREEYTICPVGGSGAKTGILRPYYWFDLARNAVTPMRVQPAVVMDRNLQQYRGLGPEAALGEVRKWIAEVRRWKGKFILILHNETFCDSGEWKGWTSLIEAVTEELRHYES